MMLFLWKEGSRGMSLSGVMSFKSLLRQCCRERRRDCASTGTGTVEH